MYGISRDSQSSVLPPTEVFAVVRWCSSEKKKKEKKKEERRRKKNNEEEKEEKKLKYNKILLLVYSI